MDYQRHYNLLIEKAQQRTTDLYTERHHIVPRCMGGTNDKDNLVALTPEEHYVAHQLLVKMYPDNRSLVHAAIMMIPKSHTNIHRSNKMYGWLKRKYQSVCKQRIGAKNGSYGRRWYHDPATLANGKFREDEIPEGWELGRVPKIRKSVQSVDNKKRTVSYRKRYCKKCNVYVDTVCDKNKKSIFCNKCRSDKAKQVGAVRAKYNYNIIANIYKEHKKDNIGYYTLAQKYGINKWSIYDCISRYKDQLEKDFGV